MIPGASVTPFTGRASVTSLMTGITTLTTSTDAGLTLMESVISNPFRSSLMSQVWYKNRRYKKAIYRFRIEGRLPNLNYKNRIEKGL